MNQATAALLYEAYEKALDVLFEAESELWKLPESDDREALTAAHSDVVLHILSKLRAPLVLKFPEIDTEVPSGPPDNVLDQKDEEAVNRLTVDQISHIDRLLLAGCASSWRKLARVIGTAMSSTGHAYPGVPDSFYSQRIGFMVKQGLLEAQGNLDYMRYSEVRLPST